VTTHEARFISPPFRHNGGRWIQLRFAEVEGRLVCVGLEIGPHLRDDGYLENVEDDDLKPLTTAEIRLPLRELIERILPYAGMQWTPTPGVDIYDDARQKFAMLETAKAESKKRSGRPPAYGPDHYALVAFIYQGHEAIGGHAPTKAVAEYFGTTKSTAAKWVARARDLELIPRASS
jgi:hypothetical protein